MLEDTYQSGDTDFSAQIARLEALDPQPDVLFVSAIPNEAGITTREIREAGLTQPILSGDGFDTPLIGEVAGDMADDVYYSTHASLDNPDAKVQDFVTAYNAAYGNAPENAFAALGYDMMGVIADAIARGSTDPAVIRDALSGNCRLSGRYRHDYLSRGSAQALQVRHHHSGAGRRLFVCRRSHTLTVPPRHSTYTAARASPRSRIRPSSSACKERNASLNKDQVLSAAQAAGVRLVRFLYCDNGCTIRGKLVPIDRLPGRMDSGQGLTVAMQAMNMLDQLQPVEDMGPVGEIRLVPDPESFVILPYAPHSAAMMCDMLTLDRQPWAACPRSFLRRMIAAAADLGFVFQSTLENEFSLFREDASGAYVPIDTALCFSSIAMTVAADVIDDMIAAFTAQGIPIDAYYPELGHGQHELPLRHTDALRAADNQIWFRETVRNVAYQHGMLASLAPKPMPDQAGNGCHIHWSIWDRAGQRNLCTTPPIHTG